MSAMKQIKISLPDYLRSALDEAALKSGRSVGFEIRTRLYDSLVRSPLIIDDEAKIRERFIVNEVWNRQRQK